MLDRRTFLKAGAVGIGFGYFNIEGERARDGYFDARIDPAISREMANFYADSIHNTNNALTEASACSKSVAEALGRPIRVIVFQDIDFMRENAPDDASALEIFGRWPDTEASGLDDCVWINNGTDSWRKLLPYQEMLIPGETFRVVQARLGVDVNDYELLGKMEIPDWLYYGAPMAWAAASLPGADAIRRENARVFGEMPIILDELEVDGFYSDFWIEEPIKANRLAMYAVDQLVMQYAAGDYSVLFEYFQVIGAGKGEVGHAEAFEKVFGEL